MKEGLRLLHRYISNNFSANEIVDIIKHLCEQFPHHKNWLIECVLGPENQEEGQDTQADRYKVLLDDIEEYAHSKICEVEVLVDYVMPKEGLTTEETDKIVEEIYKCIGYDDKPKLKARQNSKAKGIRRLLDWLD